MILSELGVTMDTAMAALDFISVEPPRGPRDGMHAGPGADRQDLGSDKAVHEAARTPLIPADAALPLVPAGQSAA
jgi:hypothetical protein